MRERKPWRFLLKFKDESWCNRFNRAYEMSGIVPPTSADSGVRSVNVCWFFRINVAPFIPGVILKLYHNWTDTINLMTCWWTNFRHGERESLLFLFLLTRMLYFCIQLPLYLFHILAHNIFASCVDIRFFHFSPLNFFWVFMNRIERFFQTAFFFGRVGNKGIRIISVTPVETILLVNVIKGQINP